MSDKNKYTESEENTARRREVSTKFAKMGKALIMEGKDNDDFCVLSAGNLLILMSGLILNAKDMDEFNNLCGMFTAKNILDDMMKGPMGGMMMAGGLAGKMAGLSDSPFGENIGDISEILKHLKDDKGGGPFDFLNDNDDTPESEN